MRLSLYKKHVAEWSGCRNCTLCEGRKNVVLARGNVPCDVLFVGEAPGESENCIGKPFIGPAGKLLDEIIRRAQRLSGVEWTFAMTNLVACIPRDEEGGKATEPDEDSIQACKPRLEQFIGICKPKLLVCVGALARDWFKSGYKHSVQLNRKRTKVIEIIHPAAIIRANVTQQGLAMQRCWVTIANAIDNLSEGEDK